jgi:hypothetical protein
MKAYFFNQWTDDLRMISLLTIEIAWRTGPCWAYTIAFVVGGMECGVRVSYVFPRWDDS